MRFQQHINEEDLVKSALSIPEPVKSKTYTEGQVTKWMGMLEKAYKKLETEIDGMDDDDSKMALKQAQLSDIGDKARKWQEEIDKGQEPEEEPVDKEVPPEGEEDLPPKE